MRIDRHRLNVVMAMMDKKPKDIVAAGVPRGTLSGALIENRISQNTADRIAAAIGCKLEDIIKSE